jgi:hypothetical protein
MTVLDPISPEPPNPDCCHCAGDGVPQSLMHQILADELSNKACAHCWQEEHEVAPKAGAR